MDRLTTHGDHDKLQLIKYNIIHDKGKHQKRERQKKKKKDQFNWSGLPRDSIFLPIDYLICV